MIPRWMEGREDEFVGYLTAKLTATQIASRFDTTRNAVISVVRRKFSQIGLRSVFVERRGTLKPVGVAGTGRSQPLASRAVQQPMPAILVEPRPPYPGTPMAELGSCQCRYAVNDARPGEPHLFCADATDGRAWCGHHRNLVYGNGTESERSAHRALVAA